MRNAIPVSDIIWIIDAHCSAYLALLWLVKKICMLIFSLDIMSGWFQGPLWFDPYCSTTYQSWIDRFQRGFFEQAHGRWRLFSCLIKQITSNLSPILSLHSLILIGSLHRSAPHRRRSVNSVSDRKLGRHRYWGCERHCPALPFPASSKYWSQQRQRQRKAAQGIDTASIIVTSLVTNRFPELPKLRVHPTNLSSVALDNSRCNL